MGWIVITAGGWGPAEPANEDAAELIHTANGGSGVIDGRGDSPQGYINDLNNAKLNVLLHGTAWANFNS